MLPLGLAAAAFYANLALGGPTLTQGLSWIGEEIALGGVTANGELGAPTGHVLCCAVRFGTTNRASSANNEIESGDCWRRLLPMLALTRQRVDAS